MARRMSNRDRIEKMREEAEATKREKREAAKARAAEPASGRTSRKPTASDGRMKLVWAVRDGRGEIAATFPYPHKHAAEAEAKRLKTTTQRDHIVTPHKVPFDD